MSMIIDLPLTPDDKSTTDPLKNTAFLAQW